ncbi:MAG: hypothetical protein KJ726_09070 [Verrucomicrobia bacterium]|nr:hypothetical protein [Verrucomicrobiota bacterium]
MSKRGRFIWIAVVVMTFNMLCLAVAPEELVIGKWSNSEASLFFYGQGIGREITGGGIRFFRYQFPSEGVISLSYGREESVAYSIAATSGELRLTATNGMETIYATAGGFTNLCAVNRRQLEGAMALYAADHEDAGPMMAEDLIPAYLAEMPHCPDGGSYYLGPPPMCSLVEHLTGDDD